MPSIGHLAVGLAGGRVTGPEGRLKHVAWLVLLIGTSFAPDLDVLAFRLGIPYGAPFGHRGAAHSIAMGVALGLAVGAVGIRLGVRPGMSLTAAILVAVSHGVLDAFTDGGKGIALLWPFSAERVFASWRPIPVSPIGLRALSPRGVAVMMREAVLFLPLFIVGLWPFRLRRRGV
jgi:inner membrane protein